MSTKKNIYDEYFLQRLDALIKSNGLNRSKLAGKLGVYPSAISEIFKNRSQPSKQMVTAIAQIFSVNVNWLETGEGEMFLKPARQSQELLNETLSKDELSRLMKELKGDRKTLAQLMAWCGLRKEEALKLRSRDVDLENNILRITGKGNKTRLAPINGATLKFALQEAIKGRALSDYVFSNPKTTRPYGEIVRGIKTAAHKAGISKKINNHLLRHTFGALFVSQGGSIRALQEILGHEDLRTTMIYSQIAAEFIQEQSDKLAAIFDDPSEMSDLEPEYII